MSRLWSYYKRARKTNHKESTDCIEPSLQILFTYQVWSILWWMVAWLRTSQESICLWTDATQKDQWTIQAWRSKTTRLGCLHVAGRVHRRTQRYYATTNQMINNQNHNGIEWEPYVEHGVAKLRPKKNLQRTHSHLLSRKWLPLSTDLAPPTHLNSKPEASKTLKNNWKIFFRGIYV